MSSHVNFWPGNPPIFGFSNIAIEIINECQEAEPIPLRQIKGKGRSRTWKYISVLAFDNSVIKIGYPVDYQIDSWMLARMCRFVLMAFPYVFQKAERGIQLIPDEVPLTANDIGSRLDQTSQAIIEVSQPALLPPIPSRRSPTLGLFEEIIDVSLVN